MSAFPPQRPQENPKCTDKSRQCLWVLPAPQDPGEGLAPLQVRPLAPSRRPGLFKLQKLRPWGEQDKSTRCPFPSPPGLLKPVPGGSPEPLLDGQGGRRSGMSAETQGAKDCAAPCKPPNGGREGGRREMGGAGEEGGGGGGGGGGEGGRGERAGRRREEAEGAGGRGAGGRGASP